MQDIDKNKGITAVNTPDDQHYRELRRKNLVRLSFTYIGPLILLTVYFYFQYANIISEGQRQHLKAIAENQANTLDLFISERLVNITNLIDDPKFEIPPSRNVLDQYLARLRRISEAFVDIGYFDPDGIQVSYAGPHPSLEQKNYSSEEWYIELRDNPENYIITDIYLGFREKPHFTIAVSRIINNNYVVLRATLDPEKIYEYIRSLEGANEVITSIVNKEGDYQIVTSHLDNPLTSASFVPPKEPRHGAGQAELSAIDINYAYSWLWTADWALIVIWADHETSGVFWGFRPTFIIISLLTLIIGMTIVYFRANKVTEMNIETERTRAQLEHASKLATVGELASGIAHEINNPLAAINEEAGLLKDKLNPDFGKELSNEVIISHLSSIQESVFRCRDITRKLLGFVRKHDIELKRHDIHVLIDSVADGILGNELTVSNIEVIKKYNAAHPDINTDGNQMQQVLLNLLKNSIDAFEGKPGIITLQTQNLNNMLVIQVGDNGKGIDPAQMDKIFMPFFTTKEVGKGTGLGLSVSYGIIKSLGGKIEVESKPGKGTMFTITLPLN